jgi:hypothetical protein
MLCNFDDSDFDLGTLGSISDFEAECQGFLADSASNFLRANMSGAALVSDFLAAPAPATFARMRPHGGRCGQ